MKLILHVDGGSRGNPGPGGAGAELRNADGEPVFEAGYFLGHVTNNQAEYTGLIRGLEAAIRAGADEIEIYADSELLVKQIHGDYRVRNAGLLPLYDKVMALLGNVRKWRIRHVRREQNQAADGLANDAMDAQSDVIRTDHFASAGQDD
ncbi:MAG: ribonuclease HI family protein [Phycisphaerae bacterium]|nr:ribonuclease HI family protein [Phycisphaerae bacterium]